MDVENTYIITRSALEQLNQNSVLIQKFGEAVMKHVAWSKPKKLINLLRNNFVNADLEFHKGLNFPNIKNSQINRSLRMLGYYHSPR